MYHNIPEPKCSQCGKQNTENFDQRLKSGIRCLNCGHEKITSDRGFNAPITPVYTLRSQVREF